MIYDVSGHGRDGLLGGRDAYRDVPFAGPERITEGAAAGLDLARLARYEVRGLDDALVEINSSLFTNPICDANDPSASFVVNGSGSLILLDASLVSCGGTIP